MIRIRSLRQFGEFPLIAGNGAADLVLESLPGGKGLRGVIPVREGDVRRAQSFESVGEGMNALRRMHALYDISYQGDVFPLEAQGSTSYLRPLYLQDIEGGVSLDRLISFTEFTRRVLTHILAESPDDLLVKYHHKKIRAVLSKVIIP